MSVDGAIWDLMREHADGEPADEGGGQDPAWSDARRDATVRVLDAAIGVVGATRQLLVVIEDVLCEQRDRVAAGAPPPPATQADAAARQRIDLTY